MKVISQTFPWSILINWYGKYGRHDLEWRDYTMDDNTRAYRVWLSEICLQQTQVERVRGYFEKILTKYPTVHDLARTTYEEFFPYYQGMGYYSRARNLLKTATILSETYAGKFPEEKSLLHKLPGVGGYTSSAILAFAFGQPYLAWDTNLEKVFARYFHGSRLDRLTEREKEEIEEDFRSFIACHCNEESHPEDQKRILINDGIDSSFPINKQDTVRAVNNALMDFAATVDLKNPDTIDWMHYPIESGKFWETRGSIEPREVKKLQSFPTPDATVLVILHKDHKMYYSDPSDSTISAYAKIQQITENLPIRMDPVTSTKGQKEYSPFILPPSLTRDTRKYVQDTFRERYAIELSVRPAHKKWISADGQPYIAVNAQIQVGVHDFQIFTQK